MVETGLRLGLRGGNGEGVDVVENWYMRGSGASVG